MLTRLRPARRTAALSLWALSVGCSHFRSPVSSRPESARQVLERVLAAEEQGDLKMAETLLAQAVTADPQNGELRWELAKLQLDRGDIDAAAAHLRYLVENDPADSRSYIRLAQMLYQQYRYGDADRLIELALERDPNHAEALILKGTLNEVWGQDDRALEHYHRALLNNPSQVDALVRIAAIQLKRGRAEQAIPVLRAALESIGTPLNEKQEVHWMLGLAYAQNERWPEAAAALAAGRPGEGFTVEQLYQVAYARFRAGDLEGASRDVAEVLKRQPQHPAADSLWAQLNAPPWDPHTSARQIVPVQHLAPQ
jgi:tetratricopeptide (TPR) repeat protein